MKRECWESPKLARLCRALKIPRWQGVGLLESIWRFTAINAPRGDIGRFSDLDIATGIFWGGDPARLTRVLYETGWLDSSPSCRFLIHDWPDHCDEYTKKKLKRQGLTFASVQTISANVQKCLDISSQPVTSNQYQTTGGQPPPDGVSGLVEDLATTIFHRHPAHRRSTLPQVAGVLADLVGSAVDPKATAQTIDRNHMLWCQSSQFARGFVPNLLKWLNDGAWTAPPPDAPERKAIDPERQAHLDQLDEINRRQAIYEQRYGKWAPMPDGWDPDNDKQRASA